jgi:predicted lipid-binding transport protein (Tim44 family)
LRNSSVQQRRFAILAAVLVFALAFAPAMVEAKAGGGSSMGSRGSKTYSPNIGSPIQRSITPPPAAPAAPPAFQPAPSPQAAPLAPPPVRQGFFQQHPFLGGLLGGFAGAGLGAMLFGGHMFGGGLGGIFSLLLQIAVIVFLVRLAIGFFRRRAGMGMAPTVHLDTADLRAPAIAPLPSVALSEADLSTFEHLLIDIQGAWSRGDVIALQHLTTPEIGGYMTEQLRENEQRGTQNRVEQVTLLKGDILEAWREGAVDYATVSLKWSAVDYTVRAGGRDLLFGDPVKPAESSEVWTLVRHLNGPWQLSAIQQV